MSVFEKISLLIYSVKDAKTLNDALALMRLINKEFLDSLLKLSARELNNLAITARILVTQPRLEEFKECRPKLRHGETKRS